MAHPGPPFAGDRCRCPRLTQARRLRKIDAAIRGSLKTAVSGRSTPLSVAHPRPPLAGDRCRCPRLTQAHRLRKIDAAIHGSPKTAVCGRSKPLTGSHKPAVCGRSTLLSMAHLSLPFAGDQRHCPWLTQARRLKYFKYLAFKDRYY